MTTITLNYPDHGDFVIEADDEGNIISKKWNHDMNTVSETEQLAIEDTATPQVLTPEQQLVQHYHNTIKDVEYYETKMSEIGTRLKQAKAARASAYKLASVIDPSLKKTRPKADKES